MKLARGNIQWSFLALALGGVFLFNPIVEFYDVLPDLIGYILICLGLWRLSDFCDEFAESLRAFRALMWISVGQLFMQWLLHDFLPRYTRNLEIVGDSINPFESPMLVLIAAFVWAVLNWYFLIPAFKSLFSGFATLAIRSDSRVLLVAKRETLYWERIKKISIRFAVLLPLLTLLPELSVLSSFSAEVDADAFNFFPFASMFRIVLGFAALIVGLIWLVCYLAFYIKLLRDKPFCQSLNERYQAEIAPRKIWLLYRRYSMALLLILIGVLCSADLRMDGHPIVSGTYCVVLVVIGYLLIGCNKPLPTALMLIGGAGLFVLCQIHVSKLNAYLESYEVSDALRSPKAYQLFLDIRWLENLAAIFTCCFLVLFLILFWYKITLLEKQIEKALIQPNRRSYIIKTVVAVVFLIGATVVSSVNAVFQLDLRFIWWIEVALTVAVFFTLRSVFMDIADELLSCAKIESANKSEESDAY